MKGLLHAWLHSLQGTFAGGHFHWTAGLIALVIVVVLIGLAARAVRGPSEDVVGGGLAGLAALIAVAAVAAAVIMSQHDSPAPAPAVIRKTTIVQHVTRAASHPLLSGWQLATVAIVVAVVALVAFLNRRRSS